MIPPEAARFSTAALHRRAMQGVFVRRSRPGGDDYPNPVCAAWWHGYGLRPLPTTPGAFGCEAHSINSWGDVAGFDQSRQEDGRFIVTVRTPVVWTWGSKRYRYGF